MKMEESSDRRKVVLVTDDEQLIRSQIRGILEPDGFIVREARDGNEAMIQVAVTKPDLVITDIIMPDTEGIETIIQLRRQHPHMPIIAITGGGRTGSKDLLKMAEQFGADRTFAKPFKPAELLKAVHEMIARGTVGGPDPENGGKA